MTDVRVLVVEDSATQAEEVRVILEAAGMTVAVAPDGRAGLDRFLSDSFDIILSDVVMPRLDGYEMCRELRTHQGAGQQVPVILLTMLNEPRDIVRALESGANAFITKPPRPAHLVGRITALVANRQLRAHAVAGSPIETAFLGMRFAVKPVPDRILDLLLTTFEDMVRAKEELEGREAELVAANEALEAFNYSVAHDLRNPLWHVGGFARLLEGEADRLSSKGQDHVRRIARGARQMEALIDGLLQLSHVERHDLQRVPTDLGSLVAEAIAELQPAVGTRDVRWQVAPLPTVACDPALVKQVFANLLANAVKFTAPRAFAEIAVGVQAGNPPAFFVADNGVGFDMTKAEKLFTPFKRLHSVEVFPGLGIGLATVQRIVRRHGGRVWAEATEEAGARFSFTLGGRRGEWS
jgi:two-component system sensor histidine kinase/response regulator